VLSPGLLALTSQVLHEAVAYSGLKVVEVHLEDGSGKASVRRHSLLKDVCLARVIGQGPDGYLQALERLVAGVRAAPTPVQSVKKQPLGREKPAPAKPQAVPRLGPKETAAPAKPTTKTLGRRLGTQGPSRSSAGRVTDDGGVLSRALVRSRIAERLSGRLSPAGLSTWSRTRWLELQRGAPAESGHRELLEETLQQLLLGLEKPSRLSDEQLVELMTALDE